MKFALIDGFRQEAQHNLSGQCPVCDQAMIAKCGEVKMWHWAHKGRRTCDPWWENETEWHRHWKGRFPDKWQEIVHQADDGEKHIADVKTERGWVIEFQHSYIKPEERRSRDNFYQKLIWVVDGKRRKRDGVQFTNAFNSGIPIGQKSLIRRISSDKCVLIREWIDSNALVFFDFGGQQVLWWLLKGNSNGPLYIAPYSYSDFIAIHRNGEIQKTREFEEFIKDRTKIISGWESHLRSHTSKQPNSRPIQHFQKHRVYRAGKSKRRL